jgi:hypothetical protein
MFALILQASVAASTARFEEVIARIRDVRDAWRQVAADPAIKAASPAIAGTESNSSAPMSTKLIPLPAEVAQPSRWTA